ncbi:hypothetical protein [Caulobacter phage Cr30]|uniref:hypothetical protein n=1 Tax=Caulobacter phage Cr30 TaxID=1357714 RepID=UPI0004A9B84E|nr:hypothetical protein OZ74_gp250 [Caulobacter phage Cr30]AGS81093.1 hypothetical protein [Caulobacter phage Cr30]
MSTEILTDIAPYFDDYDESKNFHRILFRPAVAVQARELTQLQSILQNQIERFGDNIFKSGTIIKGCNFIYDNNYDYVKLRDLRVDLEQNVVENLVGYTVEDEVSGLQALVVNAVDGYETQNPDMKTIFVKYLNTGTGEKKVFAPDDTLSFFLNGVEDTALSTKVVPSILDGVPTNAIGKGYGFSVSEGIIYQKGFFIRVESGTSAIISKYSQFPDNRVVGFQTIEEIVTEDTDESLYDNAQGYTNQNAPGAHRLKLSPTLVAYDADEIPSEDFFVIAEWQDGNIVKQTDNTEYNEIGEEFARRTFEESGNYVVKKFILDTTPANTSHFNLNLSQGLAYVNGYRVEKLNDLTVPVRKGSDVVTVTSQSIVPNYGNYVLINEVLGFFETNKITPVSLRDTPGTGITSGTYSKGSPGIEIGRAKAIAFTYVSGTPGTAAAVYRLYLTDIQMNSGQSFSNVRSLASFSSTITGIGNAVLENSKAVLKETDFSTLLFSLGQNAIKSLREGANNNNQYIYRGSNTTSKILTNGILGPITLTGDESFPYGIGTLNETQEASVIIVPSNGANSSVIKSGTVSINASSGLVTGSSTSFLSQYQVGDYINSGNTAREILSISNNTSMVVRAGIGSDVSANDHFRYFPPNVPIPIVNRNSTIVLSNTTSMTINLLTSGNSTETLSANLDCAVLFDIKKTPATEIAKEVKKSHYVKISCSNNVANTLGPWSLGIPDVFKIEGVYRSNTYVESNTTNISDKFVFDTGQRDAYYDLSYLKIKPGSGLVLSNTDNLLVKLSAFKPSSSIGQGFFTVDSYPIDDANTANATAITTATIPIYTSPTTNQNYNLRNYIDFRPVVANTAVYANTAASATINPSSNSSFGAIEKYVVAPNQLFSSSLQYFQGRVDKLLLDIYGNLSVLEGVPAAIPTPPSDVNGSMTLGEISVAPYPSLSAKEIALGGNPAYSSSVNSTQIQRYTMKNIESLDRRLQNVEYYVSLSLLEKQAVEKVFLDSNGYELVKNGVYVEDFSSLNAINFSDSETSVALDPNETTIRPRIQNGFVGLQVSNTSNVTVSGNNVMTLAFTESVAISQPIASKKRQISLSPNWNNPVITVPVDYDPYPDITTPPTTTISPIPDWVYYLYDGSKADGSLYIGGDTSVTQDQMRSAAKSWWDAAITGALPNATIDGKAFDDVITDEFFAQYGLTPKSNYYTPT